MIIRPFRDIKTQQERELEQVKTDRDILFIVLTISIIANIMLGLVIYLTA